MDREDFSRRHPDVQFSDFCGLVTMDDDSPPPAPPSGPPPPTPPSPPPQNDGPIGRRR